VAEQSAGHEPVYLTLDDVLELFAAIIDATPTDASNQLRSRDGPAGSRDGLAGALARPATHAHYEEADLALQAAVLAHGIAETQPFIDGNKRIALVAMLTFLEINGTRLRATDPELATWIIGLSAGSTPEDLADEIRSVAKPA
jgi:death-on-curing protein